MKYYDCIYMLSLMVFLLASGSINAQNPGALAVDSLNMSQRIVPARDIRETTPLLTGSDLTNALFMHIPSEIVLILPTLKLDILKLVSGVFLMIRLMIKSYISLPLHFYTNAAEANF